jgi:hypothetical protein
MYFSKKNKNCSRPVSKSEFSTVQGLGKRIEKCQNYNLGLKISWGANCTHHKKK